MIVLPPDRALRYVSRAEIQAILARHQCLPKDIFPGHFPIWGEETPADAMAVGVFLWHQRFYPVELANGRWALEAPENDLVLSCSASSYLKAWLLQDCLDLGLLSPGEVAVQRTRRNQEASR